MKNKEIKNHQMILTLIPFHGKESEAQEILKKAINIIGLKKKMIIYGGKRKIHYHIIGEETGQYLAELEKWPGIVKKKSITETQAQDMKNRHRQYAVSQ